MTKLKGYLYVAILTLQVHITIFKAIATQPYNPTPIPQPWPHQFHALLYMNLSSTKLQISNLYYDWDKKLNVNLFQKQPGELLYGIEWNNGTTFYYMLGDNVTCRILQTEVGVLRPDFLNDAKYLGTTVTDGILCNVWDKLDFIWYYEDVETKVPVRWDFYDGISTHVITFEVGAVLLDYSITQAPAYCFGDQVQKVDNVE